MPKKKSATASRRTQVLRWLADNPGEHRPSEISTGLGVKDSYPRMRVHDEVARLCRDGLLTRTTASVPGSKRPISRYALTPEGVEAVGERA